MIERNSGMIVNVSSVATRGINRVPYAAAEGGVNGLTASPAFECRVVQHPSLSRRGTRGGPDRRISLLKRYGTIDE